MRYYSNSLMGHAPPKILTCAVALTLVAAAVASGALYSWPTNKRPPLPFEQALTQAQQLIVAEHPGAYCISAGLFGNEAQDGQQGSWSFRFGAPDGSLFHVNVDMHNGHQLTQWRGPFDPAADLGPHRNVAEAVGALRDVLREAGIDPHIQWKDGEAILSYRVRTYRVHLETKDGTYERDLADVEGPAADGIRIRLREATQRYRGTANVRRYYWQAATNSYYLAQPGRILIVTVEYGSDFPFELRRNRNLGVPLFGPWAGRAP